MKTKILFILTILLISFSGCDDFLEENPQDFLSPDNLPVTEADCDLLLNGAISYQRAQNLYERSLVFLAGISADDMDVRNSSGDRYEIDRYTYLTTNQHIENVWSSAYALINECNIMINKIPETDLSDSVKEQYVAGASFLRALWYFHLVRLFGDNLILLDQPVDDFTAALELETASIESVYELIKMDIDYAVGINSSGSSRLPVEDWTAAGRPTYGAAKTLQAKIYMTMAGYPLNRTEYWDTAREAALEVLNISRYEMATDLDDMWLIENENSPEFIFSVQNHLPDYGSMLPVQTRPDGWSVYVGSEYYYLKYFEDGDLRKEAYHILEWNGKPYTSLSGKCPYVGKWVDIARDNLSDYSKRTDSNFPVFRISEVYLMFAEAELEVNGLTTEAYDALNATRLRAGLSQLSGLTSAEFKEELIAERARELTFECKRRFDLHRWGMLDQFMSTDPHASTGWNMETHEYYPAPERDALLNSNLAD
ncbi:RagB/SusD family nutrient uptake outer membrane protein [Mangrovibacterium sp.]|uniref:RagB/SusD family nutrient uptake outer membrane protein n=1 Tax=Mangrovibacterium sp. TaxID=1961364 RepID=UPI0035631DC0